MASEHRLTLPEEVALLSLKDEEGTPGASMWRYALGGALLAELLLRRMATLEERKRAKPLLEPGGPSATGDRALDRAHRRVREAKRRATASRWVSRFAQSGELREAVVRGLVHKGILRADEKQVLFFFRRRTWPEVDPGPERAVIERLRDAVFGDAPEVDARTVTLVALAAPAGILRIVVDRKELKSRRTRIGELTSGALLGEATKEAIDAARAAVVAATTAATMAATSAAVSS